MNFKHVIAKNIIDWIRDFHLGIVKNYYLCKNDTKTAIHLLKTLPNIALTTKTEIFEWFKNELEMDMSNTGSLYRAFIVYNRNEIVNLRVSTHYSTKSSMRNASAIKGDSDFEYHITITRIPLAPKSDSISSDLILDYTEIFVAEIRLCDFLNNTSKRRKIVSKLIKLLTDGTGMNESKTMSNNTKAISITESELKGIIAESVKLIVKTLNESKKLGVNGYYIVKDGCDYIYKGEKCHSVISVIHKSEEQKYHIDEDDHCYVFYAELDGKTDRYEHPYIFDELLEAIKMLPTPS
jgi:hypothetical protein